jgi:hypothetical protein
LKQLEKKIKNIKHKSQENIQLENIEYNINNNKFRQYESSKNILFKAKILQDIMLQQNIQNDNSNNNNANNNTYNNELVNIIHKKPVAKQKKKKSQITFVPQN